jgi:hypothetical protein
MGVKYVLSEPEPPTWWTRNKMLAASVAFLVIGYWLAGGCEGDASPHPSTPSPSPSVSRTAR